MKLRALLTSDTLASESDLSFGAGAVGFWGQLGASAETSKPCLLVQPRRRDLPPIFPPNKTRIPVRVTCYPFRTERNWSFQPSDGRPLPEENICQNTTRPGA